MSELKNLQVKNMQGQLMCFPVEIHANQAQPQGTDLERRIIATSGLKSLELLRLLGQRSLSMKMFPEQFLTGSWIHKISDLESEGYTCWPPLLMPSSSVGALHRRDRIWLVAYSHAYGSQVKSKQLAGSVQTKANQSKSAGAIESFSRAFIPSGQSEKLFTSEPPLVRGDNGIPKELDAIAGIGNSADPRIIYQIFKAIEEVTHG
jgi:hypothetical protein